MTHEQSIKRYICEELAPDVDPATLPTDADLLGTGIIDSLSLVRLVAWIGEEYDIPIADIEIAPEDFNSVDKVKAFIEKHTVSGVV
ncbi:acyl carrier protein [Modicisalibacter coralii]|uniref:acyl carrier protein n=1 Tax=Modicisalibacter coralii TaxID=2304602 RepID=UPI00100A78CE|nr:acyl carrier protein [Halomonas coralii]